MDDAKQWQRHRRRLTAALQTLRPAAHRDRLRVERLPAQEKPPSFAAWTELEPHFRITIRGDLGWHEPHARRRASWLEQGVTAPTDAILDTLLRHEIGHETICPRLSEHALGIRRGVREALEEHKGGSHLGLEAWLANLVADLVVNVTEAEGRDIGARYVSGLSLLWLDQATASRPGIWSKILTRWRPGLSPVMRIFIWSQIYVMPDGLQVGPALIGRHLRGPRLGRGRIQAVAEAIAGLLKDASRRVDPFEWEDLSHNVVTLLAPFLPKRPPRQWTSAPYPFLEAESGSGSDSRSDGSADGWGDDDGSSGPSEGSGAPAGEGTGAPGDGESSGGRGEPASSGDSVDASGADVYGGDVYGGTAAGDTPSGVDHVVFGSKDHRLQLDDLYFRLARTTSLDFRQGIPEGLTSRVGPFRLDEEIGELEPLDGVVVCIDMSGSMLNGGSNELDGVDLPWGDDSAYHHALLAVYSLAKSLVGAGTDTAVNVVPFSGRTHPAGWCRASELREVLTEAPHVFSPEGGSTILSLDVLDEVAGGRHPVVIIVSDGAVSAAKEVADFFDREDFSRRCVPALVEVQPPGAGASALAAEFDRRGFRVHRISDGSEMPDVIRGVSRDLLG